MPGVILILLLAFSGVIGAGGGHHDLHYGLHIGIHSGDYHDYRYHPYHFGYFYDDYPYYYHDHGPGKYTDNRNNWRLLTSGHYRAAIDAFDRDVKTWPDEVTLRVGFALASAAFGDLRAGAQAMHRAVETDPRAMGMALDHGVIPVLEDLLGRYENYRSYNLSPEDAAFMIASLQSLIEQTKGME